MKINEKNIDIYTMTTRNDPEDALQNASGTPEMAPASEGRTLAEIISDVAEQELAQYPPVSMTPEQLEAMVARRRAAREAAGETTAGNTKEVVDRDADANADRIAGATRDGATGSTPNEMTANRDIEETTGIALDEATTGSSVRATGRATKKRRPLRIAGLAAVVMLALIGALLLLNTFTTDVGANKNEKDEIQTEDGVIIEDGGWGGSDSDDNIWTIDKWEDIEDSKESFPEIIVPKYIPAGYIFQKMTIIPIETGDMTCEYLFSDVNNEILEIEVFIQKTETTSLNVEDVSRTIECSAGEICIQENGNNKIATIQYDGGTAIIIWSTLADEELVKIIDGCAH